MLRVFNNIHAASLPQNVYYRVIAVREGGTPPETRAASSACHHTTPQVWGPGATLGWHCYPPGHPSRLTLERLTTGSSPLTLHGRALSSGPIHPVVLGKPIGTLWSNIRARPTARSPPCRPDASVSPLQVLAAPPSVREGTPQRRVPPLGTCHHTVRHVLGHGAMLQ